MLASQYLGIYTAFISTQNISYEKHTHHFLSRRGHWRLLNLLYQKHFIGACICRPVFFTCFFLDHQKFSFWSIGSLVSMITSGARSTFFFLLKSSNLFFVLYFIGLYLGRWTKGSSHDTMGRVGLALEQIGHDGMYFFFPILNHCFQGKGAMGKKDQMVVGKDIITLVVFLVGLVMPRSGSIWLTGD